jgi:hypothetical protein
LLTQPPEFYKNQFGKFSDLSNISNELFEKRAKGVLVNYPGAEECSACGLARIGSIWNAVRLIQ